jgi:hypothetical protein
MPEAAKANTKAGAIAFVKFYVTAFNHAQATGDTAPLATLEAKGCVSCRDVRTAIEHTYRAGGHASGGQWVIDSSDAHRSVGRQWAVYLFSHFKPADTYPSANASPHHNPGGRAAATFFVRYNDGWKVLRWTRAS